MRASGRFLLRLDKALTVTVGVMLIAASTSIAVSQIALGLALAIVAARAVGGRRPPRLGLEWPALLLMVWALAMVPFSTAPDQSLVFYRRFYIFAALWVGAAASSTEPRRAILMFCLVAGAAAAALWGQGRILAETGGFFGHRAVTLSNTMTGGAVLMVVATAALATALQRSLGRSVRIAALLAAFPVLLALLQTMTRSAWLGMGCSLIVLLILARPRLVPAAVVIGILAGAVLLAGPRGLLPARMAAVINAQNVRAESSATRHLAMWRGGLAMVADRPLTGVGDRDLAAVGTDDYGIAETFSHGHLHSDPIMLGAIWGVPGFLWAVLFIIAQLVVLMRRWRALRDMGGRAPPWAAAWTLAGIGIWCGLGIAGLFEWYFGDAETQLLRLAIVGVALGALGVPEPSPAPDGETDDG